MASTATDSTEKPTSASPRSKDEDAPSRTGADLVEKGEVVGGANIEEASSASANTSAENDEVTTSAKDKNWVEAHNGMSEPSGPDGTADAPPLPEEEIPPLPEEEPPAPTEEDDGWAPVWEASAQAFYFYNRFTGASQWTNPRVPEPAQPGAPGTEAPSSRTETSPPPSLAATSGYNPAIHGDYDRNAWYAQPAAPEEAPTGPTAADPNSQYAATAAFNRFTGRFQNPDLNPENFNDENKSKRQMNAFFDVDAAANSHDGRSLKAERSGKKLTKAELKQFKEKRKAKKEEKRRAWLRD
jgi:hypothetical protein